MVRLLFEIGHHLEIEKIERRFFGPWFALNAFAPLLDVLAPLPHTSRTLTSIAELRLRRYANCLGWHAFSMAKCYDHSLFVVHSKWPKTKLSGRTSQHFSCPNGGEGISGGWDERSCAHLMALSPIWHWLGRAAAITDWEFRARTGGCGHALQIFDRYTCNAIDRV
jgi:hypothetical protein